MSPYTTESSTENGRDDTDATWRNEIRASGEKSSISFGRHCDSELFSKFETHKKKEESVQTAAKRVESATVEHNRDNSVFFYCY